MTIAGVGHTPFLKQPGLENVERSCCILIFYQRRQSRIESWSDPRLASGGVILRLLRTFIGEV